MFDTTVTIPAVFGDRPLLEGIRATGDLGVNAIEFFDWEANDIEDVVAVCNDEGLSLAATLSAGGGSTVEDHSAPAMTHPDCTDEVIEDLRRSIDTCERVGCPNLIATVGPDQNGIDRTVQRENVVEILNTVAPHLENSGVTLVLEPLNTRVDHPEYFLTRSDEAFDIVTSVGSSNVAVLFDIYHQQITEGDVTRRLTDNIEHIGHVHIADNPGRTEPGTGELNYENIFATLIDAEYDGYVGFEFIPEADPEDAVRHVTDIVRKYRGR
ncbi:hydroxypyruvate isomerase family protein [Halopelagius fulvigenes]|uniref:Hydroxypyruvate isomerase family protein n=1 Tax=Halopelagius fulvigenes TaxID=1198324 RepID=A0ABD5TXN2_9EURY